MFYDDGYLKFILIVVTAVILLVVSIAYGLGKLEERDCNVFASHVGVDAHEYDFWSGVCFVTVDGNTYPSTQYRVQTSQG